MTVNVIDNRWTYAGDGAQTGFNYSNVIYQSSDLRVGLEDATTGAIVEQTDGVDYTVTGVGVATGGQVVFNVAPPAGQTVVIVSIILPLQPLVYDPIGPFPAKAHERGLDANVRVAQQLAAFGARAVRLADLESTVEMNPIPSVPQRRNKILHFDTNGQPLTDLPDVLGEVNIGQNVGGGRAVYKDKDGVALRFRSLTPGSGIALTQSDDEIEIASTGGGGGGGEVNAGENVGTGEGLSYKDKQGVNLRFRSIKAGTGVTITPSADEIQIDATGAGGGEANVGANVGAGEGNVYKDKTGVALNLRSLKAGANVTITQQTDEITIAAAGGGGGGVTSWNGRTGAVVPVADDYTADQVAETVSRIFRTPADKTKLDGIEAGAQVNTVASVFSRVGAVVAAAGDYAISLITATWGNGLSRSGDTVSAVVKNSVGFDAAAIQLVGDIASPPVGQYYGTDRQAQRGWYDLPTTESAWEFDANTTAGDPGTGKFRMSQAPWGVSPTLYIHGTDAGGLGVIDLLKELEIGDRVSITQASKVINGAVYIVSGAITDNGTWLAIPLSRSANSATGIGDQEPGLFSFMKGPTSIVNDASPQLGGELNGQGFAAVSVAMGIRNVPGSTTLVLADSGKLIRMSAGGASTLTVPPNSDVAFTIGAKVHVYRHGAGQPTLTPGSGVLLNSPAGLKIAARYGFATMVQVETDEWIVDGRLEP